MKAGFDRAGFDKIFTGALLRLKRSEMITRQSLMVLSRTVLEAHHATEDVGYVNRLIEVLTPVNRKVAVLYFTHFGGFHYDESLARFTKKSGKRYDEADKLSTIFLEDPLNNIWSWATRNIEIQKKDFELAQVTAYMGNVLKKAAKAGVSQADLLRAVLKAGIQPDALVAMLDDLGEPEKVMDIVADHFGFEVEGK
jgi:predicted RecB family nuclease